MPVMSSGRRGRGGPLGRASASRRLSFALLGVLLGLFAPGAARADRREMYVLLGYEAGVGHHQVPIAGGAAATTYAGALDVTAYYGLSNTFHVGGRLRFSSSSNLRFGGVAVTDGQTPATGDAFADERGMDVGGILLYRVDTGYHWAPVFELGAGLAVHQYRSVSLYPSAGGSAVPLDGSSEVVACGSGTVLLEYRFRDRWVASTGVGVQVEGGRTPWSIMVPFRVGVILW